MHCAATAPRFLPVAGPLRWAQQLSYHRSRQLHMRGTQALQLRLQARTALVTMATPSAASAFRVAQTAATGSCSTSWSSWRFSALHGRMLSQCSSAVDAAQILQPPGRAIHQAHRAARPEVCFAGTPAGAALNAAAHSAKIASWNGQSAGVAGSAAVQPKQVQ